ncbi:MAG: diaminopimelate epimerase [Bacteriovoracaceae bacterium]|nr:diaminopimelate epimerase [Bacteriovoracaceae bacterium]
MFSFIKYSATGNDFVLVDNFKRSYKLTSDLAQKVCHRHLGIGADGLIFLQKKAGYDFEMQIFNPDGSEAQMCGNGARAALHFYHHYLTKKTKKVYQFKTMNSVYHGSVKKKLVTLEMTELSDIKKPTGEDFKDFNQCLFLNTGVPHLVAEVKNLENYPVDVKGKYFRYHKQFPIGANVDFFEVIDAKKALIALRTYERGVEAETMACGTGVVATAVSCRRFYGWGDKIQVKVKGGLLQVEFKKDKIYFQGEVSDQFEGKTFKNLIES